jgi:hypothetical protein
MVHTLITDIGSAIVQNLRLVLLFCDCYKLCVCDMGERWKLNVMRSWQNLQKPFFLHMDFRPTGLDLLM